MNSLHIEDRIVHERIVDSVMHNIKAGMGTTGMTTGGIWKQKRNNAFEAGEHGISAKRKAEMQEEAREFFLVHKRWNEEHEEKKHHLPVEQKRQEEEEWQHIMNAGMGTTGMTTVGPCMTTSGPCMTTNGPWKDRKNDVLAAMGLGLSTKEKAEIRAKAREKFLAHERRYEIQQKKKHDLLVEQKRQVEEQRQSFLARERARDKEPRKSGLVRRPSWDDAAAQDCLPPWQRTN
jgi:hypothetical protein